MDVDQGQLFVIDGDLTKIACDAVLVPVDSRLAVTSTWVEFLGVDHAGFLDDHPRFPDGARVMPYQPTLEPSGRASIWLGDIGRPGGVEDDWYADCLVQFIKHAGATLHEPGRSIPPRVAVNVAGSGRGGASHDKGLLFMTIVPQIETAAREHGVDVVLVCFGKQQYAAAQRARLRTSADRLRRGSIPDRDERLVEVAEVLARWARQQELVLFIGAGVSMGAGLKSWAHLLESLLEPVGGSTDPESFRALDFRDQAAIVARRYETPEAYRDALLANFDGGSKYSLTHGLLASLYTRENVTTNYDTLFEDAVRTNNRRCAVLPYEAAKEQERWLLKLHGSIEKPDDIVLTRDDYLGLPERAGALFGVLQAMLMTRHMLFVGYSLTDDTFHQVMHEVRRARRGIDGTLGTALVLFRDELLEELWGDVLEIVPMFDQPSPTDGSLNVAQAARQLEQVLDLTCLLAADVTSFLLDPTFASMLNDDERQLSHLVGDALAAARNSDSPIAERLVALLAPLGDQFDS